MPAGVRPEVIRITISGRRYKSSTYGIRRDVQGVISQASLSGYSSSESQVFSNRSPTGQPKRSLSLSRFSKRMDFVWFVTMRLKFW